MNESTSLNEKAGTLERLRRRVRFALHRAEDGLLDYDTMDDICTALANALVDLDEMSVEARRQPSAGRQ